MFKDKERQKKWMANYRKAHPAGEHRIKVKREVLTHYGDGRCACMKCGFEDLRALSIDHINGGGRKHTESVKASGCMFYYWLRRNGYPEGYQTLCFNCQWIKRAENKEYYSKDKSRIEVLDFVSGTVSL